MSNPRVALLLRMSSGYDRQIMRGIVEYARLHGPWSFYVPQPDSKQKYAELKDWGCTGIVSLVENRRIANHLENYGVPLIEVPGVSPDLTHEFHSLEGMVSQIIVDRDKVSRMVLQHFLDRGFRNFAFCGYRDTNWSLEHQENFCKHVKQSRHEVHIYQGPRLKRDRKWPHEQMHLVKWLASLPKPVAIMTCNDDRGRQVIDTCSNADFKVPDEIAVVGVDNDDLVCNLTNPRMSSVALSSQQGGYEAAKVLDGMMAGRKPYNRTVTIEPVRVVARLSSDILAVSDPQLIEAVRFIQVHATKGIKVSDVANALLVSRRSLEVRFRKYLGRSAHEEVRRVQIEKVCEMLLDTNLQMSEIARASGFATREYMSQIFHKHRGMTMRQYRNKYRLW